MNPFIVTLADSTHLPYIEDILVAIEESAKMRGTGIARRKPDYIKDKMLEGKAVIALQGKKFAGFCYIETWGHGRFVANSGLIVYPDYRGLGLAGMIKKETFLLSRKKYPQAKIFGLTTGLAVMKINSLLGYRPVTFSELTDDEAFWDGCRSCINFDILQRTRRKNCLCTGMIFDPGWETSANSKSLSVNKRLHSLPVYARWFRFKYHIFSKSRKTANVLIRKRKAA